MPHAYIIDRRQRELPWFTWTVSVLVVLLIAAALFYLLFSGQSAFGRVVPAGRVEKRIPVTQVTSVSVNESGYSFCEQKQEPITYIDTSWRYERQDVLF